jgi:hypothetical protein
MTTQTLITKQHQENTVWINKLLFYKDDLKVMQNRLDEVTSKNNAADFLKEVEHFQNQFIIQNEQIDILKHDVKQRENLIEKEVAANPVASDHRRLEEDSALTDRLNRFEDLFSSLRKELLTFIAKWM